MPRGSALRTRARPWAAPRPGRSSSLVFPEGAGHALTAHEGDHFLAIEHAAARGPGLVLAAHVGHAIGMLGGPIMQLGAVFGHVIELPGLAMLAHQLPATDAHRAVALVLPEHGRALFEVGFKRGLQRMALQRQDGAPPQRLRIRHARDIEHGGHDVGQVARGVANLATLGDALGPMQDQGGGDATLMNPVLVQPKRRVGQIGPGRAIALVGVFGTGHEVGVVAKAHDSAIAGVRARDHQLVHEFVNGDVLGDVLGASAVVGQENHQGVLI